MINKIITLGPGDTFSDIVARQLRKWSNQNADIEYLSQFTDAVTLGELSKEWLILPIENSHSGFVQPVVDYLIKSPNQVRHEVLMPIQYFLVGQHAPISDEILHVQFVASEQVAPALGNYHWKKIQYYHSNRQAYDTWEKDGMRTFSIVPAHIYKKNKKHIPWSQKIRQSSENITRFFVLGKQDLVPITDSTQWKTSLVLMDGRDEPGQLYEILKVFAQAGLNLFSIFSRPTKKSMGSYYFYMDVEGEQSEDSFRDALKDIRKSNQVKLLGSYQSINIREGVIYDR